MTRFIRIYHHEKDDPGSRIRVEYDPDNTGAFCVSDENVVPEKVLDPDVYRVQTLACISLDFTSARWLRDALIELCSALDAEEASAPGATP